MTKLAVALAFLVAAAPGCKRSGGRAARDDAGPAVTDAAPSRRALETAVISDVAIRAAQPAVIKADMPERDLAAAFGAVLSRSKAFAASQAEVLAGRTGVPARVSLTITYDQVDAPTGRSIVCAVEAAIDWQGGERLTPRANVLAEKPLAPADVKRAPQLAVEMVQQAVIEAAHELASKEELRQGEDAAVLAGLDADDPDVALWCLELVADRKLRGGFDRALALLKHKDAGVRAAALRALVALKDPRAVGPLAKMANFSNPEELRMVVEAVSAIGGDEAAEFLEYVATGHSDADLRNRAREGLERLGRHPGQPPEPK